MAFDDIFKLLSVREGTPQGKAIENRMIDAMGGAETIRKKFQNNPDGSVVMAHTRGPGTQPEFITLGPITILNEVIPVYLESGQLAWTYPAEGDPARFNSATWHFIDIPTTDPYLGEIDTAVAGLGDQLNSPALSEGQESLAIGRTHSGVTVLKKTVAGLYPASVFSGKLRRFIQAQYGARETTTGFRFSIETAGSSTILKYTNGATITIGKSAGIYTGDDGTWWLIDITGGPAYTITAYRMILGSIGSDLLDDYLNDLLPTEDREKIESYIFTDVTIDAMNPTEIGSFTGANGGPMAYGWKWKQDGTRASIVVHEVLGSGAADLRWNAASMHIDIAYTPQDPISASGFSITPTTTVHGEWTDGWGVFNFFVPETENTRSPSSLFSLAINTTGVKPAFNFSGVPIYGYYKDDVWVPVVVGRSNGVTGYTQQNGDLFNVPAQQSAENNYQYSHNFANIALHYESRQINSSSKVMSVSIDGNAFSGSVVSGIFTVIDTTYSGGNVADNPVANFGSQVSDAASIYLGDPPGYSTYNPNGEGAAGGGFLEWGPATRAFHQYSGDRTYRFAVVIPSCDSEAAIIVTRSSGGSGSYVNQYRSGRSIVRFFSSVNGYVPYRPSGHFGGWYGFGVNLVETTDYAAFHPDDTQVLCFNNVVSGSIGSPGGSYFELFNVANDHPVYDRGMYAYTSVDGRYIFSEGLKVPSLADDDRRFVGWA